MAAPIDLSAKDVLLSSGIGALGSVGSALLGGLFNRSNMESQIRKSKELMKFQWDHFQSPQAQVNALAAAGLNPAVALGQGGSGFSATPSAAMPTSQPIPVPNINDLSSFLLAMAQAKKTEADIKKSGQETKALEVETQAKQFDLDLSKIFAFPEKYAGLTLAWKNVALASDQHNINEWTKAKEKALSEVEGNQRDILKKTLDNMDIQLQQENKQRDEDIKLTQEKQRTEKSSQVANRASANASNAAADLSRSQKYYQDIVNDIKVSGKTFELESLIHKYRSDGKVADAEAEKAINMLNRYKHLNENDKNSAAEYLNYTFWFIKEHMPNLPIVPFLKLGK